MPFLLRISPTGKSIFVGGAAEDINQLPDPELLGEKIVDKTIASRQINSVAGYSTGSGTMRAGTLVFEAILEQIQNYREDLQTIEPTAQVFNIDALDENLSALFPNEARVGNIINEFKVGGLNSYQLLYDGTGWFAAGKIRWNYVGNEAQLTVDGEIIARTGILENLSIEGILNIGVNGGITGANFALSIDGIAYDFDTITNPFIRPRFENSVYWGIPDEDEFIIGAGKLSGEVIGYINSDGTLRMSSASGIYFGDSSIDRLEPDVLAIISTLETRFFGNLVEFENDILVGGVASVGNATADGHALNRVTADGRFLQLANTQTVTGDKTFSGSNTFSGALALTGATSLRVNNVQAINETDTPFTITIETYINCDVSVAGITINLPNNPANGRTIVIYDSSGDANTNNITINRGGTNQINGLTSTTINTAFGSRKLQFFNGNWTIL
jgi:hypothetical protein